MRKILKDRWAHFLASYNTVRKMNVPGHGQNHVLQNSTPAKVDEAFCAKEECEEREERL